MVTLSLPAPLIPPLPQPNVPIPPTLNQYPSVVTIGNITLVGREVPDRIPFGGKQMLAIHKAIGGSRVIDAMGPDPGPIRWSGKLFTGPAPDFSGDSAATRARALDALRQSGSQVQLTWGSFSYLVIVEDFQADYKNEWEIAYHISCVVVQDSAATVTFIPTLTMQVNNYLATLSLLTAQFTGITTTITPAMQSALGTAVKNANQVVGNGVLENLSLAQMQQVINGFIQAYGVFLAGNGTPTGMNLDALTAASVIDGINAFTTEANAVAAEGDVQLCLSYLGSIIQLLSSFGG